MAARNLASNFLPIRSQGKGRPLFLIHSALGSTGYYASLARELPPESPIYGINSIGLFGDDAPLLTYEQMAAAYAAEINKAFPDQPCMLAGHSIGAHIALEMGMQMGAERVPVCIGVDEVAPDLGGFDAKLPEDELVKLVAYLIAVIAWLHQKKPPAPVEEMTRVLSSIDEAGQVSQIGCWLKDLQFLPPSASDEMTGAFLNVVMANTNAGLKWSPRGRMYDGQLTIIRTEGPQNDFKVYELWQKYCSKPVQHRVTSGSHVFVMTPPHVSRLAQLVKEAIAA